MTISPSPKDGKMELLEALEGLCLGSAEMEQALWGHLPDEAMGTHTFRLGALRRARAAIHRARSTDGAEPKQHNQNQGE